MKKDTQDYHSLCGALAFEANRKAPEKSIKAHDGLQISFYERYGFCPASLLLESFPGSNEKNAFVEDISGQLLHDYKGIKPFCSRYVRDGISEIRVEVPGGAILLFFFPFGNQIIITNGYRENSGTDAEEALDVAVRIENSYLKEVVNGQKQSQT